MEENLIYGKREYLSRIYNSIKNFVGDNEVFKRGDILYVSTCNNDIFDMVIDADGVHSFLDLYQRKLEEAYIPVSDPTVIAGYAGKDIMVTSDSVANAFGADSPYFKNVVVKDADIAQTITIKANERVTLDGIALSGGKDGVNGKVTYAAQELFLKNITAHENATLYNAFEGYQKTDDPDYTGIKKIVAENMNIDCPSLTHNIINVYTPTEGCEIIIRNSKFNLTVDNTNPLRLANYMNAENVRVIFENCEWTYENGLTKNDWRWAGLAIYQPAAGDDALNGNYSKIATWKFIIRNCRYNGEKVTENNFGQHNQVVYLYNMNNDGKVTNPSFIEGLSIDFE